MENKYFEISKNATNNAYLAVFGYSEEEIQDILGLKSSEEVNLALNPDAKSFLHQTELLFQRLLTTNYLFDRDEESIITLNNKLLDVYKAISGYNPKEASIVIIPFSIITKDQAMTYANGKPYVTMTAKK